MFFRLGNCSRKSVHVTCRQAPAAEPSTSKHGGDLVFLLAGHPSTYFAVFQHLTRGVGVRGCRIEERGAQPGSGCRRPVSG